MWSVKTWENAVLELDYAFQPIVNVRTGVSFGFEALLRGTEKAGFDSIPDLFDSAFHDEALFHVEMKLREMALKKLTLVPFHPKIKLYFNVDNRSIAMADYSPGKTSRLLEQLGLSPCNVCFELSERHEIERIVECKRVLNLYKRQAYQIAIDDFGSGFSGLQLLYHSEPDFVKIDRFFVADIANDAKKKLFVSHIIRIVHILGSRVIAEGVETEAELEACRAIGCDFVQGYFVQRPTTDVRELLPRYEHVTQLSECDRRVARSDQKLLLDHMEHVQPIVLPDGHATQCAVMDTVLEAFRKNKSRTFFPVINRNGEPLGVIREMDVKEFVYFRYGKDVLVNEAFRNAIDKFITRVPTSEVSASIETILEMFSLESEPEGILLTRDACYIGFLSAQALIKVLREKNIAVARDQSSLTRLPGNTLVNEYITRSLQNEDDGVFCYFDIDHLKPFNDKHGFRLGDRVIVLLADILKEASRGHKSFIGHIGGDDFFAGFSFKDAGELADIARLVRHVVERFGQDAASFHTPEDRANGHIMAPGRDGEMRRYTLLSLSASVLRITPERRRASLEQIGQAAAALRKAAKTSPDGIAWSPDPWCSSVGSLARTELLQRIRITRSRAS